MAESTRLILSKLSVRTEQVAQLKSTDFKWKPSVCAEQRTQNHILGEVLHVFTS